MNMKRFIALFLAVVLFASSALCVFATQAEDAAPLRIAFTQAAGKATTDGSVTLFPAGDGERYLDSAAANLRWTYAIVADANGRIVGVASMLLSDAQDPAGNFSPHGITIPAGGFAIVFHTGSNDDANLDLKAYYSALVEKSGVNAANTQVEINTDWQIVLDDSIGIFGGALLYQGPAPVEDIIVYDFLAALTATETEDYSIAINATGSVSVTFKKDGTFMLADAFDDVLDFNNQLYIAIDVENLGEADLLFNYTRADKDPNLAQLYWSGMRSVESCVVSMTDSSLVWDLSAYVTGMKLFADKQHSFVNFTVANAVAGQTITFKTLAIVNNPKALPGGGSSENKPGVGDSAVTSYDFLAALKDVDTDDYNLVRNMDGSVSITLKRDIYGDTPIYLATYTDAVIDLSKQTYYVVDFTTTGLDADFHITYSRADKENADLYFTGAKAATDYVVRSTTTSLVWNISGYLSTRLLEGGNEFKDLSITMGSAGDVITIKTLALVSDPDMLPTSEYYLTVNKDGSVSIKLLRDATRSAPIYLATYTDAVIDLFRQTYYAVDFTTTGSEADFHITYTRTNTDAADLYFYGAQSASGYTIRSTDTSIVWDISGYVGDRRLEDGNVFKDLSIVAGYAGDVITINTLALVNDPDAVTFGTPLASDDEAMVYNFLAALEEKNAPDHSLDVDVEPDELIASFDVNTGAKYESGSHTVLARIGENTTIEQITGYLLGGFGKDYNYFYVYAAEENAYGNYVITAEYEVLGRPDGAKLSVVVPENGFLVCIQASDEAVASLNTKVNVGDIVVLENVDLNALAALQPGENPLEGVAKVSFYTAKEVGAHGAVDGVLNDHGYIGSDWVTNNLWQNAYAPKPEDMVGIFNAYADNDYIYIGVQIDRLPAPSVLAGYAPEMTANGSMISGYGQTSATLLRFWFRENDQERYIVDVQYLGEELGWVPVRAIFPADSSLTWDDLVAHVEFAAIYADGTLTAEIAIPKADFGITGKFSAFVTLSDNYTDVCYTEPTYQAFHIVSPNAETNSEGCIVSFSANTDTAPYVSFPNVETEAPEIPDDKPTETKDYTLVVNEDGSVTITLKRDVYWDNPIYLATYTDAVINLFEQTYYAIDFTTTGWNTDFHITYSRTDKDAADLFFSGAKSASGYVVRSADTSLVWDVSGYVGNRRFVDGNVFKDLSITSGNAGDVITINTLAFVNDPYAVTFGTPLATDDDATVYDFLAALRGSTNVPSDGWVTDNLWQNSDAPKPNMSGKFTADLDGDNVHVNVEITGTIAPNVMDYYVPELTANGTMMSGYSQIAATSFRFWLRTNDWERYLIDVQYLGEELGWVPTRAIFPSGSTLTWDDLVADVAFTANYVNGRLTAEITFSKANFGIEDEFSMFVSFWDNYTDNEYTEPTYQTLHIVSPNAETNYEGCIINYSGNTDTAPYVHFPIEQEEKPDVPSEPVQPSYSIGFTQEAGSPTAEASVTLFPAPADSDLYLDSADANLRWAYAIIADKDGTVVGVAQQLLSDAQDSDGRFSPHGITVPAGGFAIVFHTGAEGGANDDLKAYYDALVAMTGVFPGNTVALIHTDWQIILDETIGDFGGAYLYQGRASSGKVVVDGVLDDSGYKDADWVEHSFWQDSLESGETDEMPDSTGKYTVRASGDYIVIAAEIRNAMLPNMIDGYTPNSVFQQTGATEFRFWLAANAEHRSYIDLQYRGEELGFVISNFATSDPRLNTSLEALDAVAVVNYTQGTLTVEFVINKTAIGVTDSVYTLVTYADPNFPTSTSIRGNYNALQLTNAAEWDGVFWLQDNRSLYEFYNLSDIAVDAIVIGEEQVPSDPTDPSVPFVPDKPGSGTNVAKGKSYVISQLFRQGGADVNWMYDETKDIAYPDDGGELTDGVFAAANAKYSDPEWFGFNSNVPEYQERGYHYMRVDLGAVYALSELRLYVATSYLGFGISIPDSVEFLISRDGVNFISLGEVTPKDDYDCAVTAASLKTNASARFVEIRVRRASWVFVTEFEAYGTLAKTDSIFSVDFTQEAGSRTADGSVTLFQAPADEELYIDSGEANLRWAYAIIADKDGTVVGIAQNLLSDEQDSAGVFSPHGITVPAGGFAIVFHNGSYGDANTGLKAYFDALVAMTGVFPGNTVALITTDWQIILDETIGDFGGALLYQGHASVVDGVLDDAGYKGSEWVSDNLWQGAYAPQPDMSGKFNAYEDGDYVYIGVEIDGAIAPNVLNGYAPEMKANGAQITGYGQTSATLIRFWLRTNDVERYLIDVQYLGEELGWVPVRAIFPSGSALTWDDLVADVDFVATYANGKLTAEIAILKADFGIEKNFSAFVTLSDNYTDDEYTYPTYQAFHIVSPNAETNEDGCLINYSGNDSTAPYVSFPNVKEEEPSTPSTPEPPVPPVIGSNVARGKSYTTSLPYRQGGADVFWTYDENAEIAYPDTDGVELTDGIFPMVLEGEEMIIYRDPAFVGLHGRTPDVDPEKGGTGYTWVRVDLGQSYNLAELKAYFGSAMLSSGITAPDTVEFWASNDGVNFTQVGYTITPTDSRTEPYVAVTQAVSITARYIEVRAVKYGWVFVCEVEAYEQASTTGTNIAKDKTVIGPQGYGNYTADLTDGNAAEEITYDNNWFAFYYNEFDGIPLEMVNAPDRIGTFIIDLKSISTVEQVRINAYVGAGVSGILKSHSMKVEVSTDNVNWASFASVNLDDMYFEKDVDWVVITGKTVEARYVKVSIELNGVFSFLNEVEVIGTEGAPVREEVIVDGTLDDSGYEDAEWVENGMWQDSEEDSVQPDASGKFAVRASGDYIVVAVEIQNAVLPNLADGYAPTYDPETGTWSGYDQKGATTIRIWLAANDEHRSYIDVQYLGEELGFVIVNFGTSDPTLNTSLEDLDAAAAGNFSQPRARVLSIARVKAATGGTLTLELAVNKAAVGITNSVSTFVTYGDPNFTDETHEEGTYNAMQITSATTWDEDYDEQTNRSFYETFNLDEITVDDVVMTPDDLILFGDVNGDGVVNGLDRMVLDRYLAEWEEYQDIDLKAADVNKDGVVNNLDRMILTRHLAEWEDYATLPHIE